MTSRTRDRIQTKLPAQKEPGWAPVEVTLGGGTSVLREGVGVLPMLDGERPASTLLGFDRVDHSHDPTLATPMATEGVDDEAA